jgi:Tol biopolymer transport system component
MSDTDDKGRCARCGAEFTASASPLGLCPSCLFKLGMSDPAMTPAPAQEAEAGSATAVTPPAAPAPVRHVGAPRLLWIALAALLAFGVGVLAFLLRPVRASTAAHANPVRFTLRLPDEAAMPDAAQFAVSGDGSQVVVAARHKDGGIQRLWLRRLQSLEWRELPQTDRAAFPFWSPDGRHIGFFAGTRLKRIDIGNDLTETLCEVNNGLGGTWGSQGVILFTASDGLFQVPASGGTPRPVMPLDAGRRETALLRPQFLPDGRRFIVFVRAEDDRTGETYLGDLATGERLQIAAVRGPATYSAGLLLVARPSALASLAFDDERGQPIGDARMIAGVDTLANDLTKGSAFAASDTMLVYQRGGPRRRQLLWFDRRGEVIGSENDIADADGFTLSPDGRTVAVTRRDVESDTASIWLMEADGRRMTRLSIGRSRDSFPVWSPDGSRLAFISDRGSNHGAHIVVRDLNGNEDSLLQSPDAQLTDWSRDGRFLIYSTRSPKTGSDLWMLPVTGDSDRKPEVLDQTVANESQGVISPDGRLLAYVSDDSGADEVYVRQFPPSQGRWRISSAGGMRPRWRIDGRELLFLSPEGEVMAVQIASTPTPAIDVARRLLVVPGADDFALRGTQHLLVQMPMDQAADRQLEVILNWQEELKQRVPTELRR